MSCRERGDEERKKECKDYHNDILLGKKSTHAHTNTLRGTGKKYKNFFFYSRGQEREK